MEYSVHTTNILFVREMNSNLLFAIENVDFSGTSIKDIKTYLHKRSITYQQSTLIGRSFFQVPRLDNLENVELFYSPIEKTPLSEIKTLENYNLKSGDILLAKINSLNE